MNEYLRIKGARVNNLKNISIDIPLKKITCFSGPSGCGKSSLAFHTIYNESKRRFLNSFPNYLKFFSDRPAPVDVDEIFPVLPVFALPQINPIAGTRSIVADSCHLSDLFQSLYYNYGEERCTEHNVGLVLLNLSDLCSELLQNYSNESKFHALIKKEDFLENFKNSPFPSRSFSNVIGAFDEDDKYWEIFRFKKNNLKQVNIKAKPYLEKNIQIYLLDETNELSPIKISSSRVCPKCLRPGMSPIVPVKFSANNALGACSQCRGFGSELVFDEEKLINKNVSINEGGVVFLDYKPFQSVKLEFLKIMKKNKISLTTKISTHSSRFFEILYEGEGSYCGFNELFNYLERKKYKMSVRIYTRARQKEIICSSCEGSRIAKEAGYFDLPEIKLKYRNIWKLSFAELSNILGALKTQNIEYKKILKKIRIILENGIELGLGHLSLNRKLKTLSAGEYQRILLLKYFIFEGTDSLFIFDEPSLGLSQEECKKLLKKFKDLTLQGNTVILIDHNEYFHENCDHLVRMGPGAGKYGGEILLGKDEKVEEEFKLNKLNKSFKNTIVKVQDITLFEKSFPDTSFKLNMINIVKGPSGIGKSSVFVHTLANQLHKKYEGEYLTKYIGQGKINLQADALKQVLLIDSNLTRFTSRSTVGSMLGFNTVLRKHFASLPIAKSMGLVDGHFSPNSPLGQCPRCEGRGVEVIEMQFLEDIILSCEDCNGTKLKSIYGSISDSNMTVIESYSKPVHDVLPLLKLTPKFRRIYDYLKILKLDYLSLERQVNTLSGGEKQRLYLLSKLQSNITNTLIIFENLSFGLSAHEIKSLGLFLQDLVEKENTIILIDQNQHFDIYAHNKIQM